MESSGAGSKLKDLAEREGAPEPVPVASQHLPARVLPLLYFVLGHLSLAFALGAVALDPAGVAGFFYNPRMLAVVLLNLGMFLLLPQM